MNLFLERNPRLRSKGNMTKRFSSISLRMPVGTREDVFLTEAKEMINSWSVKDYLNLLNVLSRVRTGRPFLDFWQGAGIV